MHSQETEQGAGDEETSEFLDPACSMVPPALPRVARLLFGTIAAGRRRPAASGWVLPYSQEATVRVELAHGGAPSADSTPARLGARPCTAPPAAHRTHFLST